MWGTNGVTFTGGRILTVNVLTAILTDGHVVEAKVLKFHIPFFERPSAACTLVRRAAGALLRFNSFRVGLCTSL